MKLTGCQPTVTSLVHTGLLETHWFTVAMRIITWEFADKVTDNSFIKADIN